MAPGTAPVAASVIGSMRRHGLEPVLQRSFAEWLHEHGHAVEAPRFDPPLPTDLKTLVTLGGDGTFLESATLAGKAGVPVLGINLGRLGFLSTVMLEDVDDALKALAEGRFELEERALVEVDGCGDGFGALNYSLNEVSVHKRDSSTMLTVHAWLEDRYLNTYWADGLIIATPTGSTAYSLSCGGPLMDPESKALVITPIAPHNLNVRPFVVPDHHEVHLQVDARGDKYLVNLDARSVTLEGRMELRIRRAPFDLKMVVLQGHDFLSTLRAKLAWGLDARSGPVSPRTLS
jgi:NAD+ kinase